MTVIETMRVATNQLYLPKNSPSARMARKLLNTLITCTGETAIELAHAARSAIEIKIDGEDKRITEASLVFPAHSEKQVKQARKLLDPELQMKKRSGRQQNKKREPSATDLACPINLRINSYGLVAIREREAGELPLLVFRLLEEYPYETRNKKGEVITRRAVWKVKIKFLQAALQNYLRFNSPSFVHLPKSVRQGAAQEVAQLIGSHFGLIRSKTQPFTSFVSLDERNPEKCLIAWREALSRLVNREEPFTRKKHKGELLIDEDDFRTFLRGPHPKRMATRWISSDSVIIRKRKGELYAFLPIFDGIDEHSPLWQFHCEELLWWKPLAEEFETMPAWHLSKQAELVGDEPLICLPLIHQPRLEEWLSDPDRQVCWSLLTEKETNGKKEFYLHVVTKKKVTPRLRPNLLTILPTMENGNSCLRLALVENGQVVKMSTLVVDQIPTGIPRRDRSWQKARKQRAIECARHVAELSHLLNANLAIGLIKWVDKRGGDNTANTLASRWNFATVIEAIADKAADYHDPVAVVVTVSEFDRLKFVDKKESSPEEQIGAVAALGWRQFQDRLEKSV